MAKEVINNGVGHNVLASGTIVKGDIIAESDFRIDGTVEGTLKCSGRVVIGPSGKLEGEVQCANAEIMGMLNGNIVVSDTLSLKSTAKVSGDVKTKVLVIEPKAIFSGTCDMGPIAKSSVESKK
ncbi:MAG: polymer-forming cytoskeletal protein [Paludibacteraceae bacterium]|nr:polymer-forming cytoskeletal protein [Paludibacteraceae bacterium]